METKEYIKSPEEKALELLKDLLNEAGLRDRNLGYNNFDKLYDDGMEIIKESENIIINPKSYGDAIENMVQKMISDFRVLVKFTDPDKIVIHYANMKIFVLEQAIKKFDAWLDAEAN